MLEFYTVTVYENTKDNTFQLMLNASRECALTISEEQARHVIKCCNLEMDDEKDGVIDWFVKQ